MYSFVCSFALVATMKNNEVSKGQLFRRTRELGQRNREDRARNKRRRVDRVFLSVCQFVWKGTRLGGKWKSDRIKRKFREVDGCFSLFEQREKNRGENCKENRKENYRNKEIAKIRVIL